MLSRHACKQKVKSRSGEFRNNISKSTRLQHICGPYIYGNYMKESISYPASFLQYGFSSIFFFQKIDLHWNYQKGKHTCLARLFWDHKERAWSGIETIKENENSSVFCGIALFTICHIYFAKNESQVMVCCPRISPFQRQWINYTWFYTLPSSQIYCLHYKFEIEKLIKVLFISFRNTDSF